MASEIAASAAPAPVAPDRPDQPRHGKRGAPQAFARKLAEILRDESEEVINWNAAGTAFMVKDVERFSQDVLVKHYRHSKFSSFQRQLNLYQFRKIVKGEDAGGYQHPMFHRDRPEDLCHVRRSVSGSGAAAKASAKRNASGSSPAASKQQGKGGDGWAPPRAHKSAAAVRRAGKMRNKAAIPTQSGDNGARNPSSMSHQQQQQQHATSSFAQLLVADHNRQAAVAPAAATGLVFSGSTDMASSDAGEKSTWTSGESSDSDVSIAEATRGGGGGGADRLAAIGAVRNPKEPRSRPAEQQISQQQGQGGGAVDSSEEEGASSSDNSDDEPDGRQMGGGGGRRRAEVREQQQQQQQQQQQEQRFSSALAAEEDQAGGDAARGALSRREEGAQQAVGEAGQQHVLAATTTARKSPFNFFKKTFSFIDRQSSGRSRDKSMPSVDGCAGAGAGAHAGAQPPAPPSDRPMSSSSSSSSVNNAPVSPLMVDTSAAARAAAAGLGVTARGVRPPPVTVTGGAGHRVPIDPSTATGNKALISPLTPKSSMEAAALAAEPASAAMPPPPKREQREELGLVEQLTNMVEVFDICDLLRKVSTSNSSRLDKHGGIVKPNGGGPHHLRNMSVDTDQGLPQSPVQGGRQGQSPMGLGSLASMELVRDSSKDWDTLMAGSADVSDLGNTMVQSVAEFFSF